MTRIVINAVIAKQIGGGGFQIASNFIRTANQNHARRYILETGVKPEYTYVVGSPMAEVLKTVLPQIEHSTVLGDLGLEKGKYILLSAHREENIDIESNFFSLMNAVNTMAEAYNMVYVWTDADKCGQFR